MNNWINYKNGNYNVSINLDNGTKIRSNNLDFFEADTIESMDIKITNNCDMGCEFCHEMSTRDGKHADLFTPSFLDNLHPYTELAIGGGNPLSHPHLLRFLLKCQAKKWIPSMTVHQHHFEKDFNFIKQLVDCRLIYGVGISPNRVNTHFINKVKEIKNAVVHLIAGVHSYTDIDLCIKNGVKILILGYKEVGRGKDLFSSRNTVIINTIRNTKNYISEIIKNKEFSNTISFDNLALKQLDIKSLMTEEEWSVFYMGDDGIDGEATSATMFVDLVERKFAKNSCAPIGERYALLDTAEEMYKYIKDSLKMKEH